jgi:adenosylcobinamide-GDP ribazoletransferase
MTRGGDVAAGARLALSTLTVVRMPIGRVDRAAAGIAMLAAPVVGLGLGAAVGDGARLLWHSNGLAAFAVVVTLAAATGLLHWDGLADTADGVGAPAGRDRLAVMKDSGIGAFGVVTVVLVVAAQLLALIRAFDVGLGTIAVLTAVTTARLALPLGCLRGVPPARPDGLGATVAGTVARVAATVAVLAIAAVLCVITAVHDGSWHNTGRVVWSVAAGLVAAGGCYALAVRRLGGITGDVLGATVEVSTAVVLLAMCIRA